MSRSLQELLSLKGKTAVVTGGAGYLGTAMCETLAELGANLVLASRNKDKCVARAEELAKQYSGIRAIGLGVDVLDKESIKQFVEDVHAQFGEIDILINNAWSGNNRIPGSRSPMSTGNTTSI